MEHGRDTVAAARLRARRYLACRGKDVPHTPDGRLPACLADKTYPLGSCRVRGMPEAGDPRIDGPGIHAKVGDQSRSKQGWAGRDNRAVRCPGAVRGTPARGPDFDYQSPDSRSPDSHCCCGVPVASLVHTARSSRSAAHRACRPPAGGPLARYCRSGLPLPISRLLPRCGAQRHRQQYCGPQRRNVELTRQCRST